MFFNLFKNEDDVFLALDIGTNSVKAVFLEKIPESKKEKIAVLASTENYFEKPSAFSGKNLELETVKKGVISAIEQLKKNISFSKIDKSVKKRIGRGGIPVLVCLSCQKLKARIFEQNFSRKNFKNKISAKEEKEISEEVLEKAKENISAEVLADSGAKKGSIAWISSEIISKKIDGYPVLRLEGYEGKEIAFKVSAVFCPKPYFDDIKNIIKTSGTSFLKIIHISEILPRLCYKEKDKEIAFIDVGHCATQFFLLKNRVLQEINEIESGGKFFTDIIIKKLGLDEKSAELLKEKYSKGLLSPEAGKKLKELFGSEQKKWYLDLRKKIQETSKKEPFSFNIYIFGGGAQLPEIKEIIEKERKAYSEQTAIPFLNKAKIIFPKDLEWIKNLPQDLNSSQLVQVLLIGSSII